MREVIAFPKSGGGYDPLTGAPAPITAPSGGRPASTRRHRGGWRGPAEQRTEPAPRIAAPARPAWWRIV